ncbi:arginyltransferase [Algibacillus agarilyticus]|uniref:arginyltransferase n=1 Tax=Algibacillus agarilyticus TaxID=2234133 RepID=UPI000DCF80D5|nr:arginyltransferase [Algibacillus agarilyticus]
MTNMIPIKFAVSHEFDCSYLSDQKEKLLIAMDDIVYSDVNYEQLMTAGFRRSGSQVYRPYCSQCSACESIRLPVTQFNLSKSQKRVLKKNKNLACKLQPNNDNVESYFPLYEQYINTRHSDGTMYPADKEQYLNFVQAHWLTTAYLEIYDEDQLIAVSVLDVLPHSLSAVYTFFEPDYQSNSIGTLAILKAVEFALALKLDYVYLGYQIDACQKMNYKTNFKPHERWIQGEWQHIS